MWRQSEGCADRSGRQSCREVVPDRPDLPDPCGVYHHPGKDCHAHQHWARHPEYQEHRREWPVCSDEHLRHDGRFRSKLYLHGNFQTHNYWYADRFRLRHRQRPSQSSKDCPHGRWNLRSAQSDQPELRQSTDRTTSLAKTVTLSNKGGVAVCITGISIAGADPNDFSQTNTCGTSVAAGASCFIKVKFTPSATGARTATISISDNGGGSPQKVSLAGSGT